MIGLLFLLSCLLRFLLELLTNTLIDSFREQVDWQKYWKDNDCGSEAGKLKFVCKAYSLCLQEVSADLFPSSADDIWIQLLLCVILYFFVSRIKLRVQLKLD